MDTSGSSLSSPPESDDIIVAQSGSSRDGGGVIPSKPFDEPTVSGPNAAVSGSTTIPEASSGPHADSTSSIQADATAKPSAASHAVAAAAPTKLPNGTPKPSVAGSKSTPISTPTSGSRTQTRGSGRPRGSRGRGGGRGRPRKRARGIDDDGDDDDDSDSSEVYTAAATQTKSGRSINKPTVFVPPASTVTHHASSTPASGHKRKRVYRRNPESAVCKICLRGTSPLTNMIVFCDGCNSPYHRYCHHPPIDQSVVDEVDKEWYCAPCAAERNPPAASQSTSEIDLSTLVDIDASVPEKERRRFFASLSRDTLVELLTTVTTQQPSVAAFTPEFRSNGHVATTTSVPPPTLDDVPDEHPSHYPRPGYGLMQTLPPDRDDDMLVDEEDRYGVFSHVYQTDKTAANDGVSGPANKKAKTGRSQETK